MFQDDEEESAEDEKENSLPDSKNFGRGGRRSAVIDHKLRTGERVVVVELSTIWSVMGVYC